MIASPSLIGSALFFSLLVIHKITACLINKVIFKSMKQGIHSFHPHLFRSAPSTEFLWTVDKDIKYILKQQSGRIPLESDNVSGVGAWSLRLLPAHLCWVGRESFSLIYDSGSSVWNPFLVFSPVSFFFRMLAGGFLSF